jgi:predicted enzyme related to lactoylglutathione lyase
MHIPFAELPVLDQDPAQSFDVEHFGCRVAADQPSGQNGWRWIELRFEGADTTLHFLRRKDEMPSTEPVLVLVDDDVEGTIAALQPKGVEIITRLQAAPWQPMLLIGEFRDSEGNRIVLGSR